VARPRRKPTKAENEPTTDADGGTASTGDTGDPLGIEPAGFEPPDDPTIAPAEDAEYEPPPPEPIEWTPERAGAVVRAGGLVLHMADPLSHAEGGDELWRATDADAEAIGAPLARILNRYAPARRLAGVADEGELAFSLLAYAKRNLELRGELVQAERERAEAESRPSTGEGFQGPGPFGPPAAGGEPA
jgi:hypothetical protein